MACRATAERRSSEGAPDVLIELRGGEHGLAGMQVGKHRRSMLDEQLDGRMRQFPEAVAVAGVIFPERLRVVEDVQAALGSGDRTALAGTRLSRSYFPGLAGALRFCDGPSRPIARPSPRDWRERT